MTLGPIDRLGRTLRTVRHLRPQQLAAQVSHRVRGPARMPRRTHAPGITGLHSCAQPWLPSPEGQVGEHGVALVGRPPHDPIRDGWDRGANALWAYTLHYHGWLNHPDCTPATAGTTMLGWIDEHRAGVGWEPYPTSMRVLHWLGWLHEHGAGLQAFERDKILGSLAAQLEHLAAHVETHIDGNHLWTNLVALTTAGLALRGPLAQHLLTLFEGRLLTTVREQLAGDGMHGERTPTYHCLLTEQLAGLLPHARARRPQLAHTLAAPLEAMLGVLPAWTHPDGDVALWGDSQRNAPVTPKALLARLGRTVPRGHADAPVSGFARRHWGPLTVLWNRGDVGLPYQVGHVHGDALALEVSVGATRILVDAGVGTYERGAERRYARSTAAHNTVTVGDGDGDQHELWASHRIGARAHIETIACAAHRIAARVRAHDSTTTHLRSVEQHELGMCVVDRLEGPRVDALVRYFLPESLGVAIDGDTARFTAAGRTMQLRVLDGRWRFDTAAGWLGMARPSPRVCLSAPLADGVCRVELTTD